jgi:small-conductance mechanosensitive channel
MPIFEVNSKFIEHIVGIGTALQDHLLATLFDLLVGILIIRLLVHATRWILKLTQIQTGLRYVITSLVETMLWMILLYTVLQELGLNSIILFFTGSIAAIGIAMAAGGSTLVSDIVAAIFLARDKDFNVGDEVIVGWDPKSQGIIERMDSRRIRLRDADGVLHVIPNSVVERREWVVVKRRAEISALARATRTTERLKGVAIEKSPVPKLKKVNSRENAQ